MFNNNLTILYITQCSPQLSVITLERYYNIIDFIPYAVFFTSVAYLSCNWKLVPPSSQILSSTHLPITIIPQ